MDTIADPRQTDIEAHTGAPIIAKAGDLAAAVARCVSVLGATTIPVMNCVLVQCTGATLSITGTDMEIAISSTIPATGMAAEAQTVG